MRNHSVNIVGYYSDVAFDTRKAKLAIDYKHCLSVKGNIGIAG